MASSSVPLLGDDDTVPFGDEDYDNTDKLRHPYVAFFHLFFRCSAIVVYILCGIFGSSFITSFVIVILLLCMDFWTVKNISGRLLVGLRWWSYVDENGQSHWVFESRKGQHQSRGKDASEARTFWVALVVVPLIWALLFLTAIFRFNFQWLLLVGIAFSLSGANLYAYIKCLAGTNEPLSKSLSNIFSKFFTQMIQKMPVMTMMSRPQEQSQQGQTSII